MPDPAPTVLLVEDNADLAESMAFALATVGWKVAGLVRDSRSALRAVEESAFDVAILDFDLGEDTSLDVAASLRGRGRPFLFMSGHEGLARLPEAYRNETCLPKPVELESLLEALDRLAGRRAVLDR